MAGVSRIRIELCALRQIRKLIRFLSSLEALATRRTSIFVGEDAGHIGPPHGLIVEPLDRVGRVRLASSKKAASFGSLGRSWSVTWRHCARAASASSWAKGVAMKPETTR